MALSHVKGQGSSNDSWHQGLHGWCVLVSDWNYKVGELMRFWSDLFLPEKIQKGNPTNPHHRRSFNLVSAQLRCLILGVEVQQAGVGKGAILFRVDMTVPVLLGTQKSKDQKETKRELGPFRL